MDAKTGLIPGRCIGRPGVNDPAWDDFVDRAMSRHYELTSSQVKDTLISMRNRSLQSNHPFVATTDDETDQELTTVGAPSSPNNKLQETDLDEEHSE